MMSPTAILSRGSVSVAPRLFERASAAQVAGSSFSALPITRAASGICAKRSGSICAAQPVTTTDRPAGLLAMEATHRLAGLPVASAVTAQALTTARSVRPAGFGLTAERLPLDDVEAAAEGDDLEGHQAAVSNSSGASVPSHSNSTGPVIRTWPSLSAIRW